jgi:hypothetical protein
MVSEITIVLCQHTGPGLSNLADTISLYGQMASDSPQGLTIHTFAPKTSGIFRVRHASCEPQIA